MKTSAVAVRSVLRDGLEHPSGYQTARAGLATFTAVKLYRDGLDGRYKRLTPLPPSLFGKGDNASGRRRSVRGVRWRGLRRGRWVREHGSVRQGSIHIR